MLEIECFENIETSSEKINFVLVSCAHHAHKIPISTHFNPTWYLFSTALDKSNRKFPSMEMNREKVWKQSTQLNKAADGWGDGGGKKLQNQIFYENQNVIRNESSRNGIDLWRASLMPYHRNASPLFFLHEKTIK